MSQSRRVARTIDRLRLLCSVAEDDRVEDVAALDVAEHAPLVPFGIRSEIRPAFLDRDVQCVSTVYGSYVQSVNSLI